MDLNGGITENRTSMDLNRSIREAACTSLNSKLEKQPKERSQPTIYRVHKHLRDVKCTAYEPKVISIGPYHRGKDHLKIMEDHKLHTLQLLVERKRIDIMELVDVLEGVASKSRKCYADQDFELSESEFIEMLVLDGCFIIQLVLTYAGLIKVADPIFQMEWMIRSLDRDLCLFENQVPFFVLLKLFNVIYPDYRDLDFVRFLTDFFNYLYPGSRRSTEEVELCSSEVAQQGSQEIMHILDLIHRNWLPRDSQKPEEEKSDNIESKAPESQESEEEKSDAHTITMDRKGPESQESEEEKSDNIKRKGPESQKSEEEKWDNIKRKGPESQESEEAKSDNIESKAPESQESEEEKSDTPEFELIYCATRLTEANVKFKVKEAATCLFDIEFEDGTMVMPPLCIDDMTDCLFRNLIAYEQYSKQSPHNFVTQYMRLLDNLINSSKDVEILSQSQNRIITHLQGDDEVVANMVNKLSDSITYDLFKYAKLYKDVNDHCGKRKNRWMAKLRRDYFNSPWAIISFLAALVLLGLTIAQTYFAI